MKRIYAIILVAAAGLFLQACDVTDLDGLNPDTSVPANGAINNLQSARAAMNGMYDEVQDNTLHEDGINFLAQIYSDEAIFTGTFPTRFEFATLNVFPSNTTYAAVFSDFYDAINVANSLIDLLPQVDDPSITPEILNDFLGQARMARALMYHYLVSYHGDVPLILEPTVDVGEKLNVPVTPAAQVWDQIIEDLTFAENNITETGQGRFTSQAASALLARVYLYLEDWSNALAKAETVLGNGFDLTQFPYLEDEIMYIRFTTADGNVLNFYYGPSELGGRHDVEPSAKLLAAYEEGDLRRDQSVDDSFERATVPFCVKYDDFAAGISGTGTDPVFLFRYAEQLLIAAEAAAELGQFDVASDYFNQVRARAGLPELTLTADNYLDRILQERLVELALEGPHRWLDLRRTGRALQEIEGYQPCNDDWPIPQRDIDRNPNLTQNNCCNC